MRLKFVVSDRGPRPLDIRLTKMAISSLGASGVSEDQDNVPQSLLLV